MLYKNNGAVSCVVSDSLSGWALYLARTFHPFILIAWLADGDSLHCYTELCNHMHHGIQQGGSKVRKSGWTRFNHGQISIETATHSFLGLPICTFEFGKIKQFLSPG